ncbi:MAG: hypothetical protein AAGJ55_01220, partial [Cyanobacteria bacterium J06555_12]
MVRRKELKNVARGIIESFNSRNNDVDGYWGIGKLFQFANSHNVSTVHINLTTGEISPASNQFLSLVNFYQAMLESQLQARGIPSTWIVSVQIDVSFNQVFKPSYHAFRSKLGLPCVC